MDLLDFARGPALQAALLILLFGSAWRLTGILLLPRRADLSQPRSRATWQGALRNIFAHSIPHREFWPRVAYHSLLSYLFHLGLLVTLFGFVPHILFIRDLTGLYWPGLPNGVVFFVGGLTVAALLALLVRRLTHPVQRLISGPDDYVSWCLTLAPVATGLLATAHLGARYETLLALHLLSVELLLAWLPFGKLMHVVLFALSRGTTGALFARKGASA